MNAPSAAPTMIRISVGCHRARMCPPSRTNPPSTQPTTTTDPRICSMLTDRWRKRLADSVSALVPYRPQRDDLKFECGAPAPPKTPIWHSEYRDHSGGKILPPDGALKS